MITSRLIQDFQTEIETGPHRLRADLPRVQGGAETAPSPHEILEAALAACTTITLQMYAKRKGWRLDSADVGVRILSEGSEGSVISREIFFRGELDEEQRKRLLEIAERCPIHRLLTGNVQIQTKAL